MNDLKKNVISKSSEMTVLTRMGHRSTNAMIQNHLHAKEKSFLSKMHSDVCGTKWCDGRFEVAGNHLIQMWLEDSVSPQLLAASQFQTLQEMFGE